MRFQTKLTLLLTAVIVAMIAVLFYEFDTVINSHLKKTAINNFHSIIETSGGAYFLFTDKVKTRTVDWSSDGTIRTATEKIISLPEGEERALTINTLAAYLVKEKIQYDPSVSIIDILDNNGIVIASSRADRIGVDEKEEEEEFHAHRFSEALVSRFGESFITNVVIEPDEGVAPMIHSVARIFSAAKDEQGNRLPLDAVILLHFTNVEELGDILSGQFQIAQGTHGGGALFEHLKTAEIYMVNKDRILITPSRFIEDAVLKLRVDTYPVKACLEKGQGVAEEYINYRGASVFGASMCLARDNTVLIAEVDTEEILAPLKALRLQFALTSVFIALVGAFITAILSRRFLRNLQPILVAAKEVAQGNTSIRAKTTGRDEIGQVALMFNRMLDAVEKATRELNDAQTKLRNTNIDLEQRVKERTKELDQLKESLEQTISRKTVDLEKKLDELEKFKKLTVGRELKMMELKKEIEDLKNKQG